MKNELLKQVHVDELQPTDINLESTTLNFYANTFPLLRNVPVPEIWVLSGKMYIVDGHKQIRDNYNRGRYSFLAKCIVPEELTIGKDAYGYVLALILEKAKIAERKGYRHIRDLPIV